MLSLEANKSTECGPPLRIQPSEEFRGQHPIIRDEELRKLIRKCILLSRDPFHRECDLVSSETKEVSSQLIKRQPRAASIDDTQEVHRINLKHPSPPSADAHEGMEAM